MNKRLFYAVNTAQAAMLVIAFAISFTPLNTSHAQASLPQLGDDQVMSVAVERKLGQRIAREIYRDPDYLDDPVIGEYLQRIWQPLLQAARTRGDLTPELQERFAWQLVLSRDRSVNAFALPGGYLGVHLGLIALVANRDELASVLGHELSHVTQRHIARITTKQSQQTPLILAAMILGALAARQNSDVASAVITGGQAASAQSQLNFSRDMEREADRIGYQIMQDAQFNVQGFVSMFDKLAVANRINDNGSYPYLRSHPLTSERIGDMQARLQLGVPSAPRVAQNSALEHAIIAKRAQILSNAAADTLRSQVAQADAELRTWNQTPSSAPRDKLLAAKLYGGALVALKQRDTASAKRLVEGARRAMVAGQSGALAADPSKDTYAEQTIDVLQAEIALAQGDAAQARDILRPAATGNAPQRPVLLMWARAVTGSGSSVSDLQLAAQALQVWITQRPEDAPAWQAVADVYTALKQPLRAIRAQAEARVALLDYTAALDRFKAGQDLARSSTSVDHIELSIIDSRARAVQVLQRDFVNDKLTN
jgi:predicted Zn-dependent protease